MKKIIQRASLICSILLGVVEVSNAQSTVFYYWDFNQTHPSGGAGKDSLGTVYSYANSVLNDSLHKTFPLYAPYDRIGTNSAFIEYYRPLAHQPNCPNHPKNDRDSIIDNGSGGASVNDLHILGNDTGSSLAGNLYIRTRNPSENCYFYMYMPTSGYKNIVLNYAISASSTKGPLYNIFSYSTNGGSTWNNLTTAMDTFNIHSVYRPDTLQVINPTTAASNWYPVHIDFSSDPNVNNNANFIVRWQVAGYKPSYLPTDSASCYSSGNARYDNFSVSGDTLCPYFTLEPVRVILCNGGTAIFIVNQAGGTTPYNLQWQVNTGSGFTNISNNSLYSGVNTDTLTITGATTSMSGWRYRCEIVGQCGGNTLSESAPLKVDTYLSDSVIALTNVTCSTLGSATIGTSGGTSPYLYLWSPGGQTTATVTGLTAGTYTVTITDSIHCTSTVTLTIQSPANVPQALIISQTNIECTSTGNATVLAVHGTSPYTYLWTPGNQTNATATGLTLGTYTITVTDSLGCSGTNSVNITSTPLIRDSVIGLGLYQVIHYWDFNQTPPSGGGGGDSLGTATYPLPAPYTLIPGGNPRIVYSRPLAIQSGATERDSILDNGLAGAYINDLNNDVPAISAALGNDSASGNLYVRSRNPDENAFMYMYIPTNGYNNIQLNYAISASSTKGALFNVFSYSTNGGGSWNNLTAAMDTFNTGGHRHPDSLQVINAITSASAWYPVHINFGSDPTINNNPDFIVRWSFVGTGSNGTSGNDRYDNFSVSGNLDQEQCNGGSNFSAIAGVKYGVGPFTYSWSPSGGTSDTATVSAGTYTVTVTDGNGCSASSSIIVSQPAAVTATITSSTGVSCYNGSNGTASASGSGGTSPYSYSWTSGSTTATASGLSAGSYTVTVTDEQGCTSSTSVTITQSSQIRDSISSTNTGCGNSTGTATVGVSGGVSPYTYLWTNGQTNSTATGLGSGTYTVTITDLNGCTVSTSVTIVSPAGLRDSITSIVSPTCNGGSNASASIGVSGGTSPYTYLWNPGGQTTANASSLSAGTYTVLVTDGNGCTASTVAVISQPVGIRDSIVSVVGPQEVIHYWDFNNTLPTTGGGGDSLGTGTYPLPAQYTQVSSGNPRIVYSRPSARQTSPLNCTIKDSILDNGTPGAYVNDLHILNDSANGNLFVRSRNPDENSYMYLYLPTTGYSNIEMNYAISASSTKGALYNVFSYSTNGGADNFVNKLVAGMDTFNTGGHSHPDSLQMINPTTAGSNWYAVHINFSQDGRINNNPNFILRWEYEGTSSNGTSGNDRYDNISVIGNTSAEVCNGNDNVSATVGVKDGTAPYTYAWSPSGGSNATASGLSAGTYTVDITDANGCTGSTSVTITQPSVLTATITPTNESCNASTNGSATVNAGGGTSPYTYEWSPGNKTTATITGLSVGTYTVTVNDHNLCSVVSMVTITQPAAVSVSMSMTAANCNSSTGTATASVTGGTSPYTYVWSPGGQTNATATGLGAGSYTVSVTDANGCSGTGSINVTGTGENASASVTNNVLCNGGSTGAASVSVTGGLTPYTYVWSPNVSTTSSASGLSAGSYSITVTDANGCTSTTSVTITQPAVIKDSLVASGVTAILDYWDFNQTVTAGGNGGDSLGTEYSYANSYTVDTANKTAPLYAPYTIIPGGARIVYVRPSAIQSPATERDSILDNGSQGSYINDLNSVPAIQAVLGNDTSGNAADNLFVRSRNPDKNSYFYVYAPTTGYENIEINYAIQESSVKGAQYNILSYSTNGGVSWNNLPRSVDTFSVGHQPTPDTLTVNEDLNWSGPYNLNFSKVAGANNNANFVVRWTFAGSASSGSSGNDRYDNISVTGNAVQEACNGGNNVDLTDAVSGGVAPYTYVWSPNVSTTNKADNLSAGTYSVTVTDGNGCSSVASLTVTQPVLLSTAPTATGVLCNGGSTGTASANASGGTSPYTYTWSNSETTATASGLSAGSYTITVKDFNGCTASASITVTQPLAIRDSIAGTNSGCFGSNNASATVGVKYGTSPYTYLWSNSETTATATGLSAGSYSVEVTDANGCTGSATVSITQPSQLTATISSTTNATCNAGNGSATVSAAGGTSPYTYVWNPGGNTNATASLSAGTYTVLVTDGNGCTATATATITQPTALRDSVASLTDPSCNGNRGSATIGVSGGTSPYTYIWNPNVSTTATGSFLTVGTYTVTVEDHNGCSKTLSFTISQPAAVTDSIVNALTVNVSCYGGSNGSATVGASGGTPPYTYTWSPNVSTTATATGLSAGVYTVVVKDKNGCTISSSGLTEATITQPPPIRDSVASISNATCNGGNGSASIGVTGGTSPYTYTWSPNVSSTSTASNLSAGSYTVTITDNHGCSGSTVTLTITQPLSIRDSIVAASIINVSCHGSNNGSATVGVKYGNSPYTYTWSPNVSTTATATGLTAGTYSVTITDATGCTGTVAIVTITQPASAIRDSVSIQTNVVCNGSSTGSATIGVKGGTSPYTYLWTPTSKTTATVTGLSAGNYTVTVTDKNGCNNTVLVDITQPLAIRDSLASITYPLCNGSKGSATVGVKYGSSPYTYTWSPNVSTTASATNLSAGSYTVTIRDNHGCSSVLIFTVTQPGSIRDSIVKASTINVSCNGGDNGSAKVGVKYGTSPYTYLWTPTGQTTATATGLSAGTYSITITDKNGCTGTTAVITITQPSAVRDSVSAITAVGCNGGNGGAATIGVKGGTSPYTYSWSPNTNTTKTASNLSAGSYTVTVTDKNGCANTVLVTITQPAAIRDSVASLIDPLCNGGKGSAVIGVKGGTSPYTYTWSPNVSSTSTATSLAFGTYTVTIKDAHSCTGTTIIFTVTQPAAIRDSIVKTATINVTCGGGNNGSATVGAKYGTPPYTYLWSPGGQTTATVSGLSAGIYTVTVTDMNGCSGTAAMVTITQPVPIRDSLSSVTYPLCNGGVGRATVGVKGGNSPYTYTWSPNVSTTATASNLSAGSYTVTIKDKNNCSSVLVFSITQPGVVHDSAAVVVNESCNGGSNGSITIGVRGGTLPYTYSWSPNVSTSSFAGSLSAGTYTVTVTDKNGCNSVTMVTITQPSAIRDSLASVTSPTCGSSNGRATIGVKGGTNPYTYLWTPGGQTTATVSGLSAGNYTVSVTDKNGCNNSLAVTISQAPSLNDSLTSITYPVCNGGTGSASVGVKGGITPYTYTWSPNVSTTSSATGLTARGYTVIVTDSNGCSGTAITFAITQPAAIRDSITNAATMNVSCNGLNNGSATVGVKGGTLPYTYTWSPNVSTTNSATGLSAGVYSITVTDNNGCSGSTTMVTITQPFVLKDSISLVTSVGCNGGNGGLASLGVSGGTIPYTYLWTPSGQTVANATGLTAGVYTVAVTDNNGCSGSATATITQPSAIRDSLSSITYPACNGSKGSASIGVTGGTSPYNYTWSPNVSTTASASSISAGTYTVTVHDAHGCNSTVVFTVTQPLAIRDSMVTADKINVSCNGGDNGSATVGVKYGVSPYTYLWSPGGQTTATATGLSAGTYTVTITDANGCTGTAATTTITQPSNAIRDSVAVQTNVGCEGGNSGSATVGVKYGTSPYTYLWTPNGYTTAVVTGLSAGSYTVNVTDKNGCGTSVVVTITQPTVLRDSLSSLTYPVCHGSDGSATVGVAGGTSPYTYAWSPITNTTATATNLTAGSYTVTIHDNHDCKTTLVITITQPLAIRDSTVAADKVNISCNGGTNGSATLGVKYGTAPYTYLWTPSGETTQTATGLSAGTYTITVTDANGCTGTAAVTTLTQPLALKDSVASETCSNNEITASLGVTGGTPAYTYLWNPGGGTKQTMTGLAPGTYTITVTDAHGCSNVIHKVLVCGGVVKNEGAVDAGDTTGTQCCGGQFNINLYPNPNTGQFTISGLDKGMIIELYDYLGRRISSSIASETTARLNIADQPNGLYLVRILAKDGTLVTQKKVVKTQ
jgi:hypothetical protein